MLLSLKTDETIDDIEITDIVNIVNIICLQYVIKLLEKYVSRLHTAPRRSLPFTMFIRPVKYQGSDTR